MVRWLYSVLNNPLTSIVFGAAMLVIGITELVSELFGQPSLLRIHHAIILLGLYMVLQGALPLLRIVQDRQDAAAQARQSEHEVDADMVADPSTIIFGNPASEHDDEPVRVVRARRTISEVVESERRARPDEPTITS